MSRTSNSKSIYRGSLLASLAAVAFVLGACTTVPSVPPPVASAPPKPVPAGPILRPASFTALPGWQQDDLREAWPAFHSSCDAMARKPDWKEACGAARLVDPADGPAIRQFFETYFAPWQVFNPDGSDNGLVTGYYEPLLRGARRRGGNFQIPLYRTPDDLLTVDLSSIYPELKGMRLRGRISGKKVVPYAARADITETGMLNGSELVWVDNAVDAFFLQVQGSGRVQLADSGETVRLAYADQNGFPYKSIGRYLVDRGELTMDQASAQGIKAWAAAHPGRLPELLNANPSYVFFREEKLPDPSKGPKGALGVTLTPLRSIAIDPKFVPLGAPVFLSTAAATIEPTLHRLVMAQDTGGAISNAVRADFFWGFGAEAGEKAGRMKQRGMMWVLLPRAGAIASTTLR